MHSCTAPVLLQFEPVGRWYESRDARVRLLSGGSGGVEDVEGMGDESEGEEVNPLLLDPTKWKVRTCHSLIPFIHPSLPHHLPFLPSLYLPTQDQDHYVMLGLGKLRYKASAQDIRKACKSDVHTVLSATVLDRKVAAKS